MDRPAEANPIPGTPVYLTNEKVKEFLNWESLVPAVEHVLKSLSQEGQVIQPPRLIMPIPQASGALLCMPAYLAEDNVLACKVVTSFTKNPSKGLPSILATILLFDGNTGIIKMIMEGTEITTWRTAAASVVATKHVFRRKSEEDLVLAILGSGVQANIHAQAFMNCFKLKQIRVWNHRFEGAEALCKRLGNIAILFADNEECVKSADIIITATYAPSPILQYDWLKPDAHINAVGFGANHHSELEDKIYETAMITVDSLEAAKKELHDLFDAGIKFTELGHIINGTAKHSSEKCVTVFQSLGMGGEDAVAAKLVYNSFMEKEKKRKT